MTERNAEVKVLSYPQVRNDGSICIVGQITKVLRNIEESLYKVGSVYPVDITDWGEKDIPTIGETMEVIIPDGDNLLYRR